jgi:5-methyltetrahydropteroyltriglutamate--homocysteine methyltransferase
VKTAVHGMPRIGEGRALKWALEKFWAGNIGPDELEAQAAAIRRRNWEVMARAEVDFIPANDFSLYDHMLDAAVALGAVPDRFRLGGRPVDLDCYFAMARGGDLGDGPLAPFVLTKWFDTNYHHLVPELGPETAFRADVAKIASELAESRALGIETAPVLLGPITFLLKSSAAPELEAAPMLGLLDLLVDAYVALLAELHRLGVGWVRLDEPALVEDRTGEELEALRTAYERLGRASKRPQVVVSTYFGHVGESMAVLRDLPVEALGLDFCRGPENLDLLHLAGGLGDKVLFAGVVDGRSVWVNNLDSSLGLLERLKDLCGEVVVSTSCSLLHVPVSLAPETALDPEVRTWLAFAEEKIDELVLLASGAEDRAAVAEAVAANRAAFEARSCSSKVVDPAVRQAVAEAVADPRRAAGPEDRAQAQRQRLGLPLLPTTTIGSFPQTPELRAARAAWRGGRMDDQGYRARLRAEIDRALALQEEVGLDVLVHGEPERDDMVRYFAARLTGFALPEEGWVQSYGSRCVRPPVLFGDVSRPDPMTIEWTEYARSRTSRPVKGILTGPITMLRWSFVRDDQHEAVTADQLGLALRHELLDLQESGTAVVQVDEPALREGLPLRQGERPAYLAWATRAFRLVTSAALPTTQIHTHMCYAELGEIVDALAELEVDVVSLEAARSHMGIVNELRGTRYRGGVGPGVYDVHSALAPEQPEIELLVRRALHALGAKRLWVNPDCGLKTRSYEEMAIALARMVVATRSVRATIRTRDEDKASSEGQATEGQTDARRSPDEVSG